MEPYSSENVGKRLHRDFEARHDYTSASRQRSIAGLACIVNLYLLLMYILAVDRWDWTLEFGSPAGITMIVLWSIGFLGMFLASSAPFLLREMVTKFSDGPTYQDVIEERRLTTSRKYIYYPAAFATFFALAISIEISGGLVRSPFTSVFFAAILGAQQLSRYRFGSVVYISFGVLATTCLALYETVVGIRSQAPPPEILTFLVLAGAFLVTAVCTHFAKPVNYRGKGHYPDPTHAELYRSRTDMSWRFALYHDRTRLDPVVDHGGDLAMANARKQVSEIALKLCTDGQKQMEWRSTGADESLGYVRRPSGADVVSLEDAPTQLLSGDVD